MTQEDIKKIHEMIREIAPSTSMGDFGLKEQLCVELLKWKEQQMIEKSIGWIDYNNRNGGCNFGGWEKDFKKEMED